LQREMQDIQLNFTGGAIAALTCEQLEEDFQPVTQFRAPGGSSPLVLRAGRGRGGSSTVSLSEGPSPMSFSFEKPGSVSRS
jgi:hypothetical protein